MYRIDPFGRDLFMVTAPSGEWCLMDRRFAMFGWQWRPGYPGRWRWTVARAWRDAEMSGQTHEPLNLSVYARIVDHPE